MDGLAYEEVPLQSRKTGIEQPAVIGTTGNTRPQDSAGNGAMARPKGSIQGSTRPKRPFLSSTLGVALLATLACLLWGSAFPSVKIGYQLFGISSADTASQILFAGTRFTLSGLGVILIMSLVRRKPMRPSRSDIVPAIVLSLFQTTLQYALFYPGLSHASGVGSSIVEATNTFFCILVASLIFRLERLTARKLIGCAVGFLGVAAVSLSSGGTASFTFAGEGVVLLSTIAAATSSSLIQIFSRKGHDSVLLSGWQFLIGGLTLCAMGLLGGGSLHPSTPGALALLGYLAFISAAAYSIWAVLLAHNPVSRVSIFGFTNPVFGAILSALLLGETNVVSPWMAVFALGMASAGIIIVNWTPNVTPGSSAAATDEGVGTTRQSACPSVQTAAEGDARQATS